jgi:hypothetical protein
MWAEQGRGGAVGDQATVNRAQMVRSTRLESNGPRLRPPLLWKGKGVCFGPSSS